jgi:hypothetical protein
MVWLQEVVARVVPCGMWGGTGVGLLLRVQGLQRLSRANMCGGREFTSARLLVVS